MKLKRLPRNITVACIRQVNHAVARGHVREVGEIVAGWRTVVNIVLEQGDVLRAWNEWYDAAVPRAQQRTLWARLVQWVRREHRP